jgi:hypothetical protein
MRNSILALALVAGIAAPLSAATAPATRFDAVLTHYEAVRVALVADRWGEHAIASARKLRAEVDALAAAPTPASAAVAEGKLSTVEALLPELARSAAALTGAKDLAGARDAFYGVSKPLVRWRTATGRTTPVVSFCSMAKRSWLQPAGMPIGNPYYGQQMATCGEVVK